MFVMRSLLTLGGGGEGQGKQARELPLPALTPRTCCGASAGSLHSGQSTREGPECLPAFPLFGTPWGSAAAQRPGPRAVTLAPRRHDQEKPFGFFTAKRPVWKRPPPQLIHRHSFRGLGSAAIATDSSGVRTHTLYKGSDPTTSTLSAITGSKSAAAIL